MDQEQLNIGNCPHCTKILFKNAAFNSNASFTMRCPSCQRLLEVEIKTKIEIIIKSAARYLSEKGKKIGRLPMAFLFLNHQPLVDSVVCICIFGIDLFCKK